MLVDCKGVRQDYACEMMLLSFPMRCLHKPSFGLRTVDFAAKYEAVVQLSWGGIVGFLEKAFYLPAQTSKASCCWPYEAKQLRHLFCC